MFVPRGDRDLGVAYQTHPGSQASSPGKQRTPLSSRVATRGSWSPLSGLKGVQPPLPFGRPATATPGTCLPRALGGWSEPGRWSEPGLPPLAWERILIGAMCLFRAGRNDSGEENVPLDLTRGNAGRRRGRPTGEEPGLGAAGRDRPRTGPAGVRETEPEPRLPARGSKSGAVFPDPSPFPVPAFLSLSPFPGLWVLRCPEAPSGTRRSRRPSGFSRPRGERSRTIPELKQPNPRGGRREVEAVI